MTEVMTSVYELMGKISEGCKEESQIKAKVENLFKVKNMLNKAMSVNAYIVIDMRDLCLLYEASNE